MHPDQRATLSALFVITFTMLMLSGGAVSSGRQKLSIHLSNDDVEPFPPCPVNILLACVWGP
jgi:hypothetical protein